MSDENKVTGANSKSKKLWIVLPVLIAALGAAGFGYVYFQNEKIREVMHSEGIYPGVTIDGTDVSGMSTEEALKLLSGKYTTEVDGKTLTLYYAPHINAHLPGTRFWQNGFLLSESPGKSCLSPAARERRSDRSIPRRSPGIFPCKYHIAEH